MEKDPELLLGLPIYSRHRDTSFTLPDQVHQRDQKKLGWWTLSAQRAHHSPHLPAGETWGLGHWPVLHSLCCSVTGMPLYDLTWQSSSQISLEKKGCRLHSLCAWVLSPPWGGLFPYSASPLRPSRMCLPILRDPRDSYWSFPEHTRKK